MGKSWAGVVVVMSSILLAGCAGPGGPSVACPAIGWLNNLLVELEGNVSAVTEVQGCVDGVCSEFVRLPPEAEAPAGTITPDAPGGRADDTGQKPHPPREFLSPYMATPLDEDSWAINLDMDTPAAVTVRALDADGTVLVEGEFTLDWVRVGGSEQCGGPEEAGPVTLTVPWKKSRRLAPLDGGTAVALGRIRVLNLLAVNHQRRRYEDQLAVITL